jgi:hypothetical protein
VKTLFNLVWVLAVFASLPGSACDCAPAPPPKVALRESAIVFSGRVIGVQVVARRVDNRERQMRKFQFETNTVWKGDIPKHISVFTGMGGSDCGYNFKTGENYLVYGWAHDNEFGTNVCTRTCHEGAAAKADLEELGAPTKSK